MYAIEGIHPNSGNQWQLFQAINFSYIPRNQRKRFLKEWKKKLERNENIKLTWIKIKSRYPYLKNALRRYHYRPSYRIRNLKEIPFDDIDRVVVSTWSKDFSKKITTAIRSKFKQALNIRKRLSEKEAKRKTRRKKMESERKQREAERKKREAERKSK